MKIEYLSDYPAKVVQVAKWCNEEWPWYYKDGDLNAAIEFHAKTAQKHSIPCALVALEDDELIGTIAIIERDMEIRERLSPWLGCLYVDPKYRGNGVASWLIREGMNLAARLNIPKLYSWTEKLSPTLQSNGWNFIETVNYRGRVAQIFALTHLKR